MRPREVRFMLLLREASYEEQRSESWYLLDNMKTEERVRAKEKENSEIDIRDMQKPLQTKLTIMIVDQTSSLTVGKQGRYKRKALTGYRSGYLF